MLRSKRRHASNAGDATTTTAQTVKRDRILASIPEVKARIEQRILNRLAACPCKLWLVDSEMELLRLDEHLFTNPRAFVDTMFEMRQYFCVGTGVDPLVRTWYVKMCSTELSAREKIEIGCLLVCHKNDNRFNALLASECDSWMPWIALICAMLDKKVPTDEMCVDRLLPSSPVNVSALRHTAWAIAFFNSVFLETGASPLLDSFRSKVVIAARASITADQVVGNNSNVPYWWELSNAWRTRIVQGATLETSRVVLNRAFSGATDRRSAQQWSGRGTAMGAEILSLEAMLHRRHCAATEEIATLAHQRCVRPFFADVKGMLPQLRDDEPPEDLVFWLDLNFDDLDSCLPLRSIAELPKSVVQARLAQDEPLVEECVARFRELFQHWERYAQREMGPFTTAARSNMLTSICNTPAAITGVRLFIAFTYVLRQCRYVRMQGVVEVWRASAFLQEFSKKFSRDVLSIGSCVPGLFPASTVQHWITHAKGTGKPGDDQEMAPMDEDDTFLLTIPSDPEFDILNDDVVHKVVTQYRSPPCMWIDYSQEAGVGFGMHKAWLRQTTEKLFHPDTKLWTRLSNGYYIMTSEADDAPRAPSLAKLSGMMVALHIYWKIKFPMPILPLLFQRDMIEECRDTESLLRFLRCVDAEYAQSLSRMATMTNTELKQGGYKLKCSRLCVEDQALNACCCSRKTRSVTRALVPLFVRNEAYNLLMQRLFFTSSSSFRVTSSSFAAGLNFQGNFIDDGNMDDDEWHRSLMDVEYMSYFQTEDLETFLCGPNTIDLAKWQAVTTYGTGLSRESERVVAFWSAVARLSEDEQRSLLQYVTGSARLGESFVIIKCTEQTAPTHYLLPTSHACFNQLVLPTYEDPTWYLRALKAVAAAEQWSGYGLR
jgi:hypothetical protein